LGAAIKGEWDQAPSSSANGAHARHNGQAEFSSSAAEFVQASVAGGLPSGKTPRPFVVRYFSDLHTLKATTREMVVAPWLPTQTAAMIYAWRGTGKSLLALSMAIYIAAGRGFGPWHIPKPRKVIYIDGELSLADLKLRYRDLVEKLGFEPLRENLRLVSMIDPDQPQRLNLADARHHDLISSAIGDAEVVFLDSSVSLWSGKEVDAWSVVQPFMLDLRQRGKAVIFMHQAGKDREARGLSDYEDMVEASIQLRALPNHQNAAVFRLSFEKHRGFWGSYAAPMNVVLNVDGWSFSPVKRPESELPGGRDRRDGGNDEGITNHAGRVLRLLQALPDNRWQAAPSSLGLDVGAMIIDRSVLQAAYGEQWLEADGNTQNPDTIRKALGRALAHLTERKAVTVIQDGLKTWIVCPRAGTP
jgi:hypothetical protein